MHIALHTKDIICVFYCRTADNEMNGVNKFQRREEEEEEVMDAVQRNVGSFFSAALYTLIKLPFYMSSNTLLHTAL